MAKLAVERLAPRRVAIAVMEMQRGVVGDLAGIPDLAKAAAEAELVPRCAALLRAARAAGVRVVHCHAAFRADRAGTPRNVPLVERLLENPSHLRLGSPGAESVPELGPEPPDLVSVRLHGMSPFTGTELDSWLRAEQVDTVVATGVSLNVGIVGLVIEAVNHGYHVVVPRDCVVGLPVEYGRDVLRYALSSLATLTTSAELVEAWGGGPEAGLG